MFLLPLRDINPTKRAPIMTYLIIALSFLVFFYELSLPSRSLNMFINTHAFIPSKFWFLLSHGDIWGIVSMIIFSTFMHGGWMHIIGNMWFLYVFGDNVEDVMGHHIYFLFYLTASAIGMLMHALIFPSSTVPLIGGSAAISGVLGAYMVFFPTSPIETLLIVGIFPFVVYISAYWYLFYWILLQLVSGIVDVFSPVAYWAHVGGFITGLWLGMLIKSHRPGRYKMYADKIHYYY